MLERRAERQDMFASALEIARGKEEPSEGDELKISALDLRTSSAPGANPRHPDPSISPSQQ